MKLVNIYCNTGMTNVSTDALTVAQVAKSIYEYLRVRGVRNLYANLTDDPGVIRVHFTSNFSNPDKVCFELEQIFNTYEWTSKTITDVNIKKGKKADGES